VEWEQRFPKLFFLAFRKNVLVEHSVQDPIKEGRLRHSKHHKNIKERNFTEATRRLRC
jgi:hypothetical protein